VKIAEADIQSVLICLELPQFAEAFRALLSDVAARAQITKVNSLINSQALEGNTKGKALHSTNSV